MATNRMGKLLMLSIAIHFFSAIVSEFFIGQAQPVAPSPIKVSLVQSKPKPNVDFAVGKIINSPKPKTDEKSEEAKILSTFDSKAHSPKQAKAAMGETDSLPIKRKLINERQAKLSPKKIPAASKAPNKIEKPNVKKEDEIRTTKRIDKFATSRTIQEREESREAKLIEFKKEFERTSPTPPRPSEETPRNVPFKEEPQKGAQLLEGDEIDLYIKNNPQILLDMGDEAIVSLNTKKFEYIGYFDGIKRALMSAWNYPDEAIINGLSGQSLLRFTLASDGLIQEVKLVNSSGEMVLDDASTFAITSAGPFAPFPPTLNKSRLHIVATFTYQPSFSAVP